VKQVLDCGRKTEDFRLVTDGKYLAEKVMKLVETLKRKSGALKVAEIAELLGVTPQHIYRMAANGTIPSFRISGAVRFDPDDVATWLQGKQGPLITPRKTNSTTIAA
jgi:excisionase family DNA binding protein